MHEVVADGSGQYRQRYAESDAQVAARCRDTFDHVLIVPVYGEAPDFVDGYRAAARRAGRLLAVVVLNGRAGAEAPVHEANAACFRALRARFSLRELGGGAWLGHDADLHVLLIDRFTGDRCLPTRQGVGLARKIGADVALQLIATGRVRHPFMAMTDADARLPADYFTRVARIGSECSAAVLPFWHEASGHLVLDRATALYEIRLRYFQRGLRWAGSPYAFHTVGSTMVAHALCYAQVRGVPRRRAGEDFYLLNKLSKLRPVACLRGEPVRLRSRLSERVPFGTGAESAKLARGAPAQLYHPDCFAAVREVVQGLRQVPTWEAASGGARPGLAEVLAGMSRPVKVFLDGQGALDGWRKISAEAPTDGARLRRLHDWFDGFRTLKLIHHVRDHAKPSLPWQEAVRRAPFMVDVEDDGACLTQARAALLELEQRLPELAGPSAL